MKTSQFLLYNSENEFNEGSKYGFLRFLHKSNSPQFSIPENTKSSVFTINDQNNFNNILINYHDIISHGFLFEKMKGYEHEYNSSSHNFYKKWSNGLFPSDPKTSDWASIYRLIYGHR